MLKVQIPKNEEQIKKQIRALNFQLTQDTTEKDKKIHQQAIYDLESALAEH